MTTPMEAVADATALVPRLYAVGGVPPKPVYPYGVYSALLGGGTAYTLDSQAGLRSGLVSVQTFGKTTAAAIDLMEKATGALLDHNLEFDGYEPTTPLRAAIDRPAVNRDTDDNGVITVTLPFTFTVAKEAS